jgi:hypothetical protein
MSHPNAMDPGDWLLRAVLEVLRVAWTVIARAWSTSVSASVCVDGRVVEVDRRT